jgi:hypothetical protein
MLFQEGAPGVIQQQAVGLQRLLHLLAGPLIFFDKFDGLAEEFELHEGRLAALPRDRHLWRAMSFEQLSDVALERRLRHPVLVVRIERLFRQKEAVRAVDVAGRAAGLREEVEAGRRVERSRWNGFRSLRVLHRQFQPLSVSRRLSAAHAQSKGRASAARLKQACDSQ